VKLALEEANEIMRKCGGDLDLSGTDITTLPEGLTVGGSLDLSGTGITTLPEGLTVGGWLDLSGTGITNPKVKKLRDGDYVKGKYLYADGILTHVKEKKTLNGYTVFVGKIPGKNVVSDGKNYAHCNKIREGIEGLRFKSDKDRGADQYRNISLDDEKTVDELVIMYRVITGACQQGSQAFVDSLGSNRKERYTIREAIELTRGQYGAERFAEFFAV